MRWWPVLLFAVACESHEDFPRAPDPIGASRNAPRNVEDSIDETGFRLEFPRPPTVRNLGDLERIYELDDINVRITLEKIIPSRDQLLAREGLRETSEIVTQERDELGWRVVTDDGRRVIAVAYVGDGGFLCVGLLNGSPTPTTTQTMQSICKSLTPTSGLAHPLVLPSSISPSQMRADGCKLVLDIVRAKEPAPPKSKRKKTKQQLAEDKARVDALDAAYARRQETCERLRWTEREWKCLGDVSGPEDAAHCVPEW